MVVVLAYQDAQQGAPVSRFLIDKEVIGSSVDRDYDTISTWTLKLIVTSVTPPNTQGDKNFTYYANRSLTS